MNESTGKTKVYYDAECKVCQISADLVGNSSEASTYEMINVHTAELPDGFDRSKMLEEIYVTTPDGTIYKNADAILQIAAGYWYLRPLVWIGRLPGCIHLLRFLYGILSRNRHRFNW
jgi:predicted DCC family thiol-disulfide oxidoreductase YuxK